MKFFKKTAVLVMILALSFAGTCSAAVKKGTVDTKIVNHIDAAGQYTNWEGVSNVSQFVYSDGNYAFAYDGKKSVTVVKTKNGKPGSKKIKLAKKHPLFGAVTADDQGNFYLVTGETNNASSPTKNTIFISKYDKNGKHIATIGDKGDSSLAYYYDASYYTKTPFDAGNCDVAVNGDDLAVHYARTMYSGHQSDSLWVINMKTMEKVDMGTVYSSHSFGQRVIAYQDGFLLMSHGDCYNRAFTVDKVSSDTAANTNADIFHFWVRQGAFDDYNMYEVNNTYAHIGDLAQVGDHTAAFVGTSVKSLNANANKEKQQLFIQIFDPDKDLSKSSAYVTTGTRKGKSGNNGDQSVTDYGVKWLTNDTKKSFSNPQAVADGKGNLVVLFEQYQGSKYQGVYYMILNKNGKVTTKKTLYSKTARLNPCETPIYAKGAVNWTGNSAKSDSKMYVYQLKL